MLHLDAVFQSEILAVEQVLCKIATFRQNTSGDVVVLLMHIPTTRLVAVHVSVAASEVFDKAVEFLAIVQHFFPIAIPCGQEYNPKFLQSIRFVIEMLMCCLPFLKKRDDRQNLWSLYCYYDVMYLRKKL